MAWQSSPGPIDRRDAKRTVGNLSDYDVVVKYEIENFKDEPVTVDIVETMPNLRAEIVGNGNLVPQWEIGADGTTTRVERDITDANRTQLVLRQQTEVLRRIFETDEGASYTGEWSIGPDEPAGKRRLQVVVEGEVTLTNEVTGESRSYGPGEGWFVEKGTPVLWTVTTERFVKHYLAIA